MIETINKNNVGLTLNELRSGDMNSDNLVDASDFPIFAEGYTGANPIPATSTWGNVLLILATLTLGTLAWRSHARSRPAA